jgi:hypothetical protein
MARSTQAQRAERVRAAQELLARGTSMVEAAVLKYLTEKELSDFSML